MSGLNESQPAVVPHLWHAVLTTVTSVPVSLLILVWPWHSNLCSICPLLCILVELEWRCWHWKHSCTWFSSTGIQWWLWSCQADISLFASHSIPSLCSSMCAEDAYVCKFLHHYTYFLFSCLKAPFLLTFWTTLFLGESVEMVTYAYIKYSVMVGLACIRMCFSAVHSCYVVAKCWSASSCSVIWNRNR